MRMLERTVSLLRRLVGMDTPLALDPGPGETDRRASARYRTELEVTCRPAGDGPAEPLTGRVINISLGGIRLVADRRFDPGDLLSIELPGVEGRPTHTVLACVVHVSPLSHGEWTLGCNFSCELTDDDLAAFGARRQRAAPPHDQRIWHRFPCDVQAKCEPVTEGDGGPWPVQVLNISASGIGLLSNVAVATGRLLTLSMRGPQGNPPLTVLACVVHATQQDDGWALGCNFIRELKEHELESLV
jgi:hypothetical protein